MHPEEQVGMTPEKFAEIHERLTNGEYPQPMVVLRDAQALADEVERLRECLHEETKRLVDARTALGVSDTRYRLLHDAHLDQIKRNNALLEQFETTGVVSLPTLSSLPPGMPPLPNLWPARPEEVEPPLDDMRISAFVVGMDAPSFGDANGALSFDLRELDTSGQDSGRPASRPGARVTVAIPAKGDVATTCAKWLAARFRSPILVTFSDPDPPEAEGGEEETPE